MKQRRTEPPEYVQQDAARLIYGDTLVVSQHRHPAGSECDMMHTDLRGFLAAAAAAWWW